MKKINYFILAFFIVVSLNGCSTSTAAEKGEKNDKNDKNEKKTEASALKEQKGSIPLTKAEFLARVYNYEKNTDSWVYEGDKPAIVDFYADWCQPCKIASPILDELAHKYDGQIYVYKVNTEKERELAAAFGIRSIPTFLLIPMNERPQAFSGIGQTEEATREIFEQAIDQVLLKNKINN
ncbi:MAG: thiol reductase thioredoxin [Bacteroidales bacterium]|nr:thiol reductase thioredoxin [Bacteroidales bacterium]